MAKGVNVHSSNKISGKPSFAEKSNVQKSSSQGPRAGRAGTVRPAESGSSTKGSATIANPLLQAAGILPTPQRDEQQTQFSDEANNGQRRSNNEYQKQKEKTRFLDEAQNGREAAEKKAQDKARNDYQLKQKNDARQSAADATAEADRLEAELAGKYGYNPVATSEEEATAIADTEKRIAENRSKAEAELAKVNTTNSKRDAAVEEYLKAVEAERTIADGATILNQAELDAASANRKQKEEALKELNRSLGNDEYFGLVDEAQSRDLFEGWAGERAAGSAAALGTGMEWLGDKLGGVSLAVQNGETGEEREIFNAGNALTDAGSTLFNAAQGWQNQAQSDWESGTSNMSETEKQIAGLGKTAADMTMDMIENFIVPGGGRVAMAARVAGGGALTQAGRERNDVDARMTKAVLDGAVAFLSEYLLGGAEQVYGKSIVGKGLEKMFGKASPILKTVLNTEGLEEGLEYALGYLGDRLLKLDPNGEWSGDELKQNMLVGYIMGVLFNGIAGGIEYTAPKIRAGVDEAIDAVSQNIPPQEAARMAMLEPDENVKIDPTKQIEEPKAEATAEPEPIETPQETPQETPKFNNSMDNGKQSEWHTFIRNTLSGGAVSEADIDKIIKSREARQAFSDVTGIPLVGKSEADVRRDIGMAAGSVPTQVAEELATTEPEGPMRGSQQRRQIDWLSPNPTISIIQELGTITPRQAAQIRNNADLRAEFERVYEISLDGLGEKAALDAITRAVTGARANDVAVEAWETERGAIPVAEPSFANEGPGEKGSKDWKEYKRATKARQDVADILAGTELTRKDATRLMNDEIMWAAFQDATGISLGKKPKTEQNVRDAFREAKANMPEPEVEADAEAEAETAEPQTEEEVRGAEPEQEAQETATETTAETEANESTSEAEPEREANDTGKQSGTEKNASTNTKQDQNQQNQQGQQEQKNRKTDHTKKTTNPNEETDAEFDKLNTKYGSIDKGEKAARDINVPKKDTKGMKVGEGARTIFEADATPEERVASLKAAVVNGNFGHIPVKNDTRSKNAAKRLAKDGWSRSVSDFLAAVDSGRADADTIALGAHLLNEAGNSTECSGRQYVQLAMAYNDAVSGSGKALAAARILKTLTPEGKLYGMEKAVEKINKEIRKNNEKKPGKQKAEVKLNEELVEDYLKAETDEQRDAIHDEIIKDAAAQVPNTFRDKFTALRYLNMLGNFKTQVRNVLGNIGMTAAQKLKNEVRSGLEGIASATSGGKYERQYKARYGAERLKTASADFASDEDLQKIAMGEKKFSDVAKQSEAEILDEKKPFSDKNPLGKFLNGYSKVTNAAMELGDLVFVRANYADALAGYMNAHGITAADWEAMVNDPAKSSEVEKARNFAIKQAQEATFRDTNAVSNFASSFDRNWGKGPRAVAQGVIPFRRTPANVLVRMEEYSPLGAVNTIVKGIQSAKGTAEVSDVIDSAAKSVTGTGLTYLGYLLASMGKARTKDDDKNEEALAKLRGQQDYSVEVGGKSVTMDWLSPASAPFFMGVELYNLMKDGGINPSEAMAAITSFTNPMLEMSMLSGVNDALNNLSDFEGDNSAVLQFFLNSAWSYLTQGISNTMLGQVEQFSEKNRQTYYTDSDNPLLRPSAQKKLAKLGNKTPGVDYQSADYIDAWGRKQESDSNPLARGFNTFLNPGYVSDLDKKATEADAAIEELYQFGKEQKEEDNFPNVVPRTPSRSTTVNGTKLTPEEYDEYATTKGQESLNAVSEFVNSEQFKSMDRFSQAQTISDIYSYSEFLAAKKIAESRGEEYYDERYSPLLTGQKEDGENTYKAPIKEADIPEYLGFMNAYNRAMNAKDYDEVDALIDSARSLPRSAMTGATQHATDMEALVDMKEAGLSDANVWYQFKDEMKDIYSSEKRTAAKSSDYIRAIGSGKYSNKDADAIMGYERRRSEETVQHKKDQVQYNLDKAGMGGEYSKVWSMIESVDTGDMSKDSFNKYIDKNVPIQYRKAIKDACSDYVEDRHKAGKYVSGFYQAVRDAGYDADIAAQFYALIDANYNGSYTKKEIDAAVRKGFGTGQTAKDIRRAIKEYTDK